MAVKGRRFFIWVNNDEHGPFREALVLDRYLQGKLPPQAFVWTYGLQEWVTAEQMFGDQLDGASPLPPGSEVSGITKIDRAIETHDPVRDSRIPRNLPALPRDDPNAPTPTVGTTIKSMSTEHKVLILGGIVLVLFFMFLLGKFF